jgi:hypothetical protein
LRNLDLTIRKAIFRGMKTAAIRPELKIVGFVLLVGLVFAVYTQHAWEDYWITFRASRNLATGHGLVFTPGERLHTFTSPLGVLLPAAFSWLTGNQSDNLVLWLFRVVSAGALAAGMVLLFRTLQTLQLQRFSCWLTVALIGLDAKTVDFAINGMETGLLFFFLALAIHGLMVTGPRQMFRLGIGWAGLMWTRPDSCVYIAILGIGALLFLSGREAGKSRMAWGKTLLAAGLVCAVLYLPWFLWAWWYYGSPVPYTVVAKATNAEPMSFPGLLGELLLLPVNLLGNKTSLRWTFLPAYAWMGGWPAFLQVFGFALGLVAVLGWMIPVLRPQTRLFSLACFLGNFFLNAVVKLCYPWYLPVIALFGYLTIGLLFDQVLCLAAKLPSPGATRGWLCHLPQVLRVSAVSLVAAQLALTLCVARQMQVQQDLIENGTRRQIGLWLRDRARTPRDTVMLEPLGYIGYYSGLKMLDYPGLSSKEVVDVRRRLGKSKENLAYLELKPDWLVLRPVEIRNGSIVAAERLQELYDLVQVFDVTDKVRAIRWLPGRSYLQFDQTFLVFHRKSNAIVKPPDSTSPFRLPQPAAENHQ